MKMPEEKQFLISLDQLKRLVRSDNMIDRQDIAIDVMAHPYKERSGGAAVAGSLGNGLRAVGKGLRAAVAVAVDAIEREADPNKKKRK